MLALPLRLARTCISGTEIARLEQQWYEVVAKNKSIEAACKSIEEELERLKDTQGDVEMED